MPAYKPIKGETLKKYLKLLNVQKLPVGTFATNTEYKNFHRWKKRYLAGTIPVEDTYYPPVPTPAVAPPPEPAKANASPITTAKKEAQAKSLEDVGKEEARMVRNLKDTFGGWSEMSICQRELLVAGFKASLRIQYDSKFTKIFETMSKALLPNLFVDTGKMVTITVDEYKKGVSGILEAGDEKIVSYEEDLEKKENVISIDTRKKG